MRQPKLIIKDIVVLTLLSHVCKQNKGNISNVCTLTCSNTLKNAKPCVYKKWLEKLMRAPLQEKKVSKVKR